MKFLGFGRKQAVAEPAPATGGGTTRAQGNAAEDRALAHLQSAGLQLLERIIGRLGAAGARSTW